MNIASGSKEVTMDEIGDITDFIQDQAGLTADIIWGNCHEESLGEKLSVTIIATGFKTRAELGVETEREQKSTKTVHVLDPTPNAESKNEEATLADPLEPVLKTEGQPAVAGSELTFEFTFPNAQPQQEAAVVAPVTEKQQEERVNSVYNLNDTPQEDPMDDQLRKSKERIAKLKSLSMKIGGGNVTDLEREPAYRRRNVKLDSVPHSSESNVSRYTLTGEEEGKKSELRPNNSFLHDNVD
jgi:cell division protein FtsZ